jgi:PAS domain S-box-containing protein
MRDSPPPSPAPKEHGLPESVLRAVFDANPLPLWIYDAETLRVLAVNDRALDYFGHRREHVLAAPVTALGMAPDAVGHESEGGGGAVHRHYKADGTSVAMRLATSVLDFDGRAARLVVAIEVGDANSNAATELDRPTRRGETVIEVLDPALPGSARDYRDIVAAVGDWMWKSGSDDRVGFLSPAFEASTGVAPHSLLGSRLAELAAADDGPVLRAEQRAAVAARRPFRELVFKLERMDGLATWLQIAGTPIFEAGCFRGYCGVGKTMTAWVDDARRYRELFEVASDWMWEMDPSGRISYVSPNFETLYGPPVAESLGRRLNQIVHARIEPEMGRKAVEAMNARQPIRDIIYRHEFADNRSIWAKLTGIPIYDFAGVFCGYWGVSKDITAEVEAETALRESENQSRQVLEASADYYWEQDAHYRYTYLSAGWEKLIGPAAMAIGKRQSDIPGISLDTEMGKMVVRQLKVKQPYRDFVFSNTMPDGRTAWFRQSGSPVFDRDGVFRGYRGTGAEITKHVEAEAAARLAQSRLQEALVHVSQPIVVYDAEDRLVVFNQAFFDLHRVAYTGYAPLVQGASFRETAEWQLTHGFYADNPEDAAIELETLLGRYRTAAEHPYHLRDGRWMLTVYRSLPEGGRVGLWTDITALKRAEAERRVLEAQLHHTQRLEALGTLAGGAAHEINNALVPVIALTKLVARTLPEGSRERHNLGIVVGSAERSRDLVKQILAFSRKEDKRPQGDVDLGAVLREALALMRATVPSSIRIDAAIAPTPVITGDANELQQVVVNMISNAAQAIGPVLGNISVSLEPEADCANLRLSVADTGCGMDEATIARVFEPFFTTKPVGEGTGLGLSVVHGIIKAHSGRIEVKSTPGQGSRFDLFLPIPPTQRNRAA